MEQRKTQDASQQVLLQMQVPGCFLLSLSHTAAAAPNNAAPLVLGMVPGAFPTVIGNRTCYDLGGVGETHTYLVQATGMGPSGVRACIEEGIRALAPCALILVGMAFGLQLERQQIGDLLLSRQVQDSDPQRWGIGADQKVMLHSRGNRVAASEWLLDRFTAGEHQWRGMVQAQGYCSQARSWSIIQKRVIGCATWPRRSLAARWKRRPFAT